MMKLTSSKTSSSFLVSLITFNSFAYVGLALSSLLPLLFLASCLFLSSSLAAGLSS